MKYKINITAPAKDDLKKTSNYISCKLKNKIAARNLIIKAWKAIRSLEKMPYRFPLVSDSFLAKLGFRIYPLDNYLIFYIVREETQMVVIQRFIYGSRDWISLLKNEI